MFSSFKEWIDAFINARCHNHTLVAVGQRLCDTRSNLSNKLVV